MKVVFEKVFLTYRQPFCWHAYIRKSSEQGLFLFLFGPLVQWLEQPAHNR